MKIHRFIDDFDLSKKELEITDKTAHQIIKVLKLKIGEKIELCNEKQISVIAEIYKIKQKSVLVKILDKKTVSSSNSKINLFCAILKKENFELVVQKCTECGVSKIIPIITSRTIKTGLNIERLQKIAKEASEQSGRIDVPEILEPKKFEEAIKNLEGEIFLFDTRGELFFERHCTGWRAEHSKFSAENYVCVSKDNSPIAKHSYPINILIGPEGGWTADEIKIAKENNFKIVSLGPLTLRGETAAIIATYLISNIK